MRSPCLQEEIMSSWERGADGPVVSICCITYNHVEYIEDALRGFLSQETDFPFEILIHDDASTDGTTEIVRRYEKKYPNIIKAVIQKDNQYSKGVRFINPNFLFPLAKGKYIALCEADDFWCSKEKLSKQYHFMERNSNYSFCFHAVRQQDETNTSNSYQAYEVPGKEEICFEDILQSHYVPTLSLFFRKSMLPLNLSSYNKKISSGDIFMELMLASNGPGYYFRDVMGVYRHHDFGVTKQWSLDDKLENYENLYGEINQVTLNKYNKKIQTRMANIYLRFCKLSFLDGKYLKSIHCFYSALRVSPSVIIHYFKNKFCS